MKLKLHLAGVLAALAFGASASAEPIRHTTATFAGLDKTTGRIINFDVAIDETVQFGALQVTPRVCNTRPQTEAPQTTSFVEVDELLVKPDAKVERVKAEGKDAKQDAKRIFSGWMFASSPGLHGVEHPVYDVWLVDCKGGKETVQSATPGDADTGKKSRSRRVEPAAPAPVENQPIGPADAPEGAVADPLADPAAAAPPVDENAEAEAPKKKKKKKRSRGRAQDQGLQPVDAPPGDPLQPF